MKREDFISATVLGVLGFALVGFLLLPTHSGSRHSPHLFKMSKLRQVVLAAQSYALDHGDTIPEPGSWHTYMDDYLDVDGRDSIYFFGPDRVCWMLPHTWSRGGMPTSTSELENVTAFFFKTNGGSDQAGVAYWDGTAKTISSEKLASIDGFEQAVLLGAEADE